MGFIEQFAEVIVHSYGMIDLAFEQTSRRLEAGQAGCVPARLLREQPHNAIGTLSHPACCQRLAVPPRPSEPTGSVNTAGSGSVPFLPQLLWDRRKGRPNTCTIRDRCGFVVVLGEDGFAFGSIAFRDF